MLQQQVPVISNEEIAPRHFHMVLEAPEIAGQARPGQFLHARTAEPNLWDPLLRRPLSLFWADDEAGRVGLLYRVGATSRAFTWLSNVRPGEVLDVLGPLGEGVFRFDSTGGGRPVLVGGGVGIPPLYFLATRMAEADLQPDAYLGFSDSESVMWVERFSDVCRQVVVTTMDGGLGRKGLVTEPLVEALGGRTEGAGDEAATGSEVPEGPRNVVCVYACGPQAMMAAVSDICRARGIPSQLSLEERMGCGVGACLSCIALVNNEPAGAEDSPAAAYARRKRICVEGPVFPGEAVIFS